MHQADGWREQELEDFHDLCDSQSRQQVAVKFPQAVRQRRSPATPEPFDSLAWRLSNSDVAQGVKARHAEYNSLRELLGCNMSFDLEAALKL
jgi:hypothetical protein